MRLKIKSLGDDVEGIELKGNPANPEPTHARIMFPGGDVDVVRTSDNEYWVHIRVNRADATSYDPCQQTARIVDARADTRVETISGVPFAEHTYPMKLDDAYHFAVRVGDIMPSRA